MNSPAVYAIQRLRKIKASIAVKETSGIPDDTQSRMIWKWSDLSMIEREGKPTRKQADFEGCH
jgi:hypothetical protein